MPIIYTIDTPTAERIQGVQNWAPILMTNTREAPEGVVYVFQPDGQRVSIVAGWGGAMPANVQRTRPPAWKARSVVRYEDSDDLNE